MEMLKEDKISKEQKERLMDIALGEMDRLNNTITDYLSFSRPAEPAFERVDLNALLTEAVELLKNSDNSKVKVEGRFHGALFITADAGKLKEVFWNLGVNALQSMPGGGKLIVDTEVEGHVVKVHFLDTGTGVSEEDMDRIFYPFFTTKLTGTGLGLSTAFRAVQDHGGRITVESDKGEGSVFTVIIPIENVS
jgi:signal transduction histidine kinase